MSQGWRDTLQWLKCLLCSRLTPVLISNTTANHPGAKRRERGVLGSPIRHSLKTSKDNYISQSISKDIIFKNILKRIYSIVPRQSNALRMPITTLYIVRIFLDFNEDCKYNCTVDN